MAKFSYKARSRDGSEKKAVFEAPDQKTAMQALKTQGLLILEIKQAQPDPISQLISKIGLFKKKVKTKEIVLFSRQFSTLVSAGVPIIQGLSIVIDQAETPEFKAVLRKLREDIEQGVSITEAMSKHPDVFTQLYVAMIKSGEIGGILDIILERLSTYLEAAEVLKAKVKAAMVYPGVISVVAGGVTLFLLMFVIPTFQTIFSSFGADLPLPTKVLIMISDALRQFWYLVVAIPITIVVAFNRFRKTEKGQLAVDKFSLTIPIFGLLLKKVAVAKFSRTFGTLIKSGVPILQALDTVGKTSGNKVIENAIQNAKLSIREGERMADPLKKTGVFPPMVVQMIAIGEETGNLDTMLAKIADFYDQEVDTSVKGLTSMIEPLIMVVMGLVIGAIVMAMFMPMFEMGSLAAG
ncbi:type II secretion system F family protein [Elusimicrobiota bacterium]